MTTGKEGQLRMSGAWEVAQNSGWGSSYEEHITQLERVVIENPDSTYDYAKALIEYVCRSILIERGITPNPNNGPGDHFRETLNCLALATGTKDRASGLTESLKRTVQGMKNTVESLGELRNAQGPISHGKDAYFDSLGAMQAELAAKSTDLIVKFIYQAHRAYPVTMVVEPVPELKESDYSRYEDFNQWFDESSNIIIIGSSQFSPSEVLFSMDNDAYMEELLSWLAEQTRLGAEESGEGAA